MDWLEDVLYWTNVEENKIRRLNLASTDFPATSLEKIPVQGIGNGSIFRGIILNPTIRYAGYTQNTPVATCLYSYIVGKLTHLQLRYCNAILIGFHHSLPNLAYSHRNVVYGAAYTIITTANAMHTNTLPTNCSKILNSFAG